MRSEALTSVQPAMLKWAREKANISVAEAASALKIPESTIMDWEQGNESPTWSQLEKLAYNLYKRPAAIFFFPEPPEIEIGTTEFRSMPGRDLELLDRDTILLIRKARAWQIALEELYDGHSPSAHPIWKEMSLSVNQSVISQAEILRQKIFFGINAEIKWSKSDLALKVWRKAVENCGVFVFKNPFKQKDISGFCLEHEEFPVIVLNNSTSFSRQIFSLLHELVHVVLRRNAICSLNESIIDDLLESDREIEIFCNAVAANILVPQKEFLEKISTINKANLISENFIQEMANHYAVSRRVILRRLLDLNYVDKAFYNEKSDAWDKQLRPKSENLGGNYYSTQNSYLSQKFLQDVFSRYARSLLSREDASELIGIPAKNFDGLESQFLKGWAQ
ncbi:MAG: ImmA/IrrE family metallo-endopeptidase [Candidatus Symbiobacter sp.]|nr:ImmA/IrrE family metallo-endopeptidase [Candidatus Symbiobacter sp.]